MIQIRPKDKRGQTRLPWLQSYHSFSFGEYYDPRNMEFRALRVLNDDVVAPGGGFPMHPHRDMEIVTYVLDGELEHRDSMGNGSVVHAGEVQKMTAGTGVRHSEFNASREKPVHLLQIWIQPERRGLPPAYEQKQLEEKPGLTLIGAPPGEGAPVTIHQDVRLYVGKLGKGDELEHVLERGRHAWVQVTRGQVELAGNRLVPGDAAAVSQEARVELVAREDSEILLFDLN